MKTLYYEIKIREPGWFLNNGFVKVEIGEEIKLFGVLTNDILIGEEEDGRIKFSYFVYDYEENFFEETFIFYIQVEDFQLPERFIPIDEDGNELIITIENKIENKLRKYECDRTINEIIDVFEDES